MGVNKIFIILLITTVNSVLTNRAKNTDTFNLQQTRMKRNDEAPQSTPNEEQARMQETIRQATTYFDENQFLFNQKIRNDVDKLHDNINELRNYLNFLHKGSDGTQNKSDGTIENNNECSKHKDNVDSSQSLWSLPKSCQEALTSDTQSINVFEMYLPNSGLPSFKIGCMHDRVKKIQSWTIIMRRQDASINFTRRWVEYEQGFGTLNGEYFIGLQKLHALTQTEPQELGIMFDNGVYSQWTYYDAFAIDGAEAKYTLRSLGKSGGIICDPNNLSVGNKFSTWDADNDSNSNKNCAREFKSAGWYGNCESRSAFLFGPLVSLKQLWCSPSDMTYNVLFMVIRPSNFIG